MYLPPPPKKTRKKKKKKTISDTFNWRLWCISIYIQLNWLTPKNSIRTVNNSYWLNALNGTQVNPPSDILMFPTRYGALVAFYGSIIELSIYSFIRGVTQQCIRLPRLFLQGQIIYNGLSIYCIRSNPFIKGSHPSQWWAQILLLIFMNLYSSC